MERDLARYWPVFLLPTAAAFAIGFLIPFAMGLYLSFCDFTTLSNATFVGFGNYVRAFEDSGGFTHALWYTALFAGLSTVLINLFGLTVALLLVRGFRGTNLFRTVFFMPNLIGGIVLGWLWQVILNYGVLARYGVTLVTSEWYGFWGLMVVMLWQQAGYMMIIYISGLQSIPGELSEAAAIDGATKWQQVLHVTIPHLRTMIAILFIMNVGKIFASDFGLFYNVPMQNGALFSVTQTIDTYVYRAYMATGDPGQSSAAGLLQNVLGFVCILTANGIVKKIDSESSLF